MAKIKSKITYRKTSKGETIDFQGTAAQNLFEALKNYYDKKYPKEKGKVK